MFKIVVLVSGGGTNLQALLDAIDDGRLNDVCISAVISSNPGAFALERAKRHGITAMTINKSDFEVAELYEDRLSAVLLEYKADLIVLAGFMTILSASFVRRFENKIINVHPSLIPSFCGDGYYGLRVHKEALEKGVKLTGATVHFVDAVTDGGPIILQKAVEVFDNDTPETLQQRVMEQAEWKILPNAVSLISKDELEIVRGIVRRKR